MPTSSEIEREIRQRAERRRQEIMEVLSDGILNSSHLATGDKVNFCKEIDRPVSWAESKRMSAGGKENRLPTHVERSDLLYPARPARSVYTSPLITTNRPPLWKTPPPYADASSHHRYGKSPSNNEQEAKVKNSACQKSLFATINSPKSPSAPPLSDNSSVNRSKTSVSSFKAQRLYPSLPRSDPNEIVSPKEEKDMKDYSNRSTASASRYSMQNLAQSFNKKITHVDLSPINNNKQSKEKEDDLSPINNNKQSKETEDVSVKQSSETISENDIEDTYDMDRFLEEALGSALRLNSTMTDERMTDYSADDSFHSVESFRFPNKIHTMSTLRSSMRLVRRCPQIEEQPDNVSKLLKEAEMQQQLMGQASKALTLCRSSKAFSNSASLVDAERLLLLTTLRHKAILDEIRGISPSPSSSPTEFKGQLRVFEVTAPLKEDSLKWCKSENDQDLWFLCVLCYQQQVLASDAVTYKPGAKCITFSGHMELKNLPTSFIASLQVYLLRTFKPQSAHKSRLSKAYQILRRRRKSCLDSAGSEQLLHLRTPAFALSGSVSINLQQVNNPQPLNLQLEKVPIMSPLRGNVWVKMETSLTNSVQLSGFLTILDIAGGSHSWQRRWCHLRELSLHFWNYPADQDEKDPLEVIDLRRCCCDKIELAPRHLCARTRTLMLEITRSCAANDFNSTIMECKADYTVVRYFLSCDSAKDMNQWSTVLNQVLSSIKAWNIQSKESFI